MKQKRYVLIILMIVVVVLILAESLYALDLEVRPRLETGTTIYSIEYGAANKSVLTRFGETSGYNSTQNESEFVDTMGFVGCGTTFFFNRMFVDLNGRYTLNGSDQTSVRFSNYWEDLDGRGVFVSGYPTENAKFNRADYALSVGLALNRHLSIYAGYKWTALDLNNSYEGPMALETIDSGVMYGSAVGHQRIDFRYEGLFLGLTHGWELGVTAQGMLSINLGLAYLNSEYTTDDKYTIRFVSVSGQEIDDPIVIPGEDVDTIKGDTLGVALGINWQADTMLKDLSYSVGISGYRYKFDSKRSDYRDISESTLNFKLGLSYAF